jgi:hypothetical protein
MLFFNRSVNHGTGSGERKMKMPLLFFALSVMSGAALAGKSCDDLKSDIAAKIDANQVASYTLDIVASDQAA